MTRHTFRGAAAAALVLALLAGCTPPRTTTSSAAAGTTAAAPSTSTSSAAPGGQVRLDRLPAGTPAAAEARTLLAQLREAAPGPMDGYERDCDKGKACVFGRPWIDTDGDGCDQRSQVLARDLDDVQRKPGRGRCKVTAGVLRDPYTSTEVPLAKVQIDHVVPLAAQWRAGAAAWPLEKRIQAANDLGNLLAVQDKANANVKRDKTADQYMPRGFECGYSRIYTGVKARYGLTVTAAERAALTKGLATCPQ